MLAILAIIWSCKTDTGFTVRVKIENSEPAKVLLYHQISKKVDTLLYHAVSDEYVGNFDSVDEHYLQIMYGKKRVPLYVDQGFDVTVKINPHVNESASERCFTIEGRGSEVNCFLYDNEVINGKIGFEQLIQFTPDSFHINMQRHLKGKSKAINQFRDEAALSSEFVEIIELQQKINAAYNYETYRRVYPQIVQDPDIVLPDVIVQFGNDIPDDNRQWFNSYLFYHNYVMQRVTFAVHTQMQNIGLEKNTPEYYAKEFEVIQNLDALEEAKSILYKKIFNAYAHHSDSVRAVIKEHAHLITDKKYLIEFEKLISKLEQVRSGMVAPGFSYTDINGKQFQLADFKGKLVYIDIWATWCGPCVKQIPYLQELEKKYHHEDIAFVSISIDNDKKAWEKYIQDNGLAGYQLHAPGGFRTKIIQDYYIKGIPRFILIDKAGRIIKDNAPRPSDISIEELINRYLSN